MSPNLRPAVVAAGVAAAALLSPALASAASAATPHTPAGSTHPTHSSGHKPTGTHGHKPGKGTHGHKGTKGSKGKHTHAHKHDALKGKRAATAKTVSHDAAAIADLVNTVKADKGGVFAGTDVAKLVAALKADAKQVAAQADAVSSASTARGLGELKAAAGHAANVAHLQVNVARKAGMLAARIAYNDALLAGTENEIEADAQQGKDVSAFETLHGDAQTAQTAAGDALTTAIDDITSLAPTAHGRVFGKAVSGAQKALAQGNTDEDTVDSDITELEQELES